MASGARLAWEVVLEPPGLPQKYEVLIDAVSRESCSIAETACCTPTASGVSCNPMPWRSESREAARVRIPSVRRARQVVRMSSGRQSLTRSLTTFSAIPRRCCRTPGRLQGNNVHVFRGGVGREGAAGTLRPTGGTSTSRCKRPRPPRRHLFFLSNFLHDFFYDLGFDEAAGNFQESNFGRGGRRRRQPRRRRPGAGRNNATFEPKPDGQRSIMSMFLWDGTDCWAEDVDGDGALDLDGDSRR